MKVDHRRRVPKLSAGAQEAQRPRGVPEAQRPMGVPRAQRRWGVPRAKGPRGPDQERPNGNPIPRSNPNGNPIPWDPQWEP